MIHKGDWAAAQVGTDPEGSQVDYRRYMQKHMIDSDVSEIEISHSPPLVSSR